MKKSKNHFDKPPALAPVKGAKFQKGLITLNAVLDVHSETPIAITVSVREEDWKRLHSYCEDDPEGFVNDFKTEIVYTAYGTILTEKEEDKVHEGKLVPRRKPRGKRKNTAGLVSRLKEKAGGRYALFKHWIRRPENEWPEYFQKIVGNAEDVGYIKKGAIARFKRISQGDRDILTGLTLSSLMASYGEEIRTWGLKIDNCNLDSFYKTYIADGRGGAKYKLFETMTPKGVERLSVSILKD